MLDINFIREHSDVVRADLKRRGDVEKIKLVDLVLKLDEQRRKLQRELDRLRHDRNAIAIEIARMRKEGKDISFNRDEMAELSKKIQQKEIKLNEIKQKLKETLFKIPNLLHESVPIGKSDADNVEIRGWGKKPLFRFEPADHVSIMLKLDIADFERAAKIAGARFYFLKNEGVLLNFALMRYAMDFMIKSGFTPVFPPFLMRRKPYEGVVDLDDFENVMYKVENEDLYLIATSEHPLIAMFMDEIIDERNLPVRLAGWSTCFRKEAGTHGKDTKGIFRVHQFDKVEQIVLTKPDQSWEEFERLIRIAEKIFQGLEIPYRIVNVCTGDIGSIAAKKYDLEVWLPAQNRYREAVSCSNCTDYQARRLRIRYGLPDQKPKGFVHTLNSTALATSRAIIAIIENYQQEDGSVIIPTKLRPYLDGMKKIEPK